MKTKEELNALKEEVETLNKKLAELTEEETERVCGGIHVDIRLPDPFVHRLEDTYGKDGNRPVFDVEEPTGPVLIDA